MKTIIAEKPSVAREIARIVGAGKREEGYLTGNGYNVTWAFGHLVQPAMPEEYNLHGFVRSNLPIIPETFTLVPRQVKTEKGYKADSSVVAQIKIITRLFKDSDQIIVATDAGREGELIFRYLYHYIGCTVPFVHLWISSLTDKAIREGLKKLEDGSKYDNLYHAAKARSEADWLVGINGTQALSIAAGRGTYSVGRVQTPTLAMICERYWENRRFTPEAFWQLHISAKVQDSDGIVKMPSVEKWKDKATATALYNNVKESNTATVVKVERKEKIEETPLLYDLTTLQKDANTKYGFTAEQTLDITQKLYEKKLVTYPRTGSRYIPEDVFAEIPKLLAFIGRLSQWSDKIPQKPEPTRRSVDDSKVTDHHALLVTGEKPLFLSEDSSMNTLFDNDCRYMSDSELIYEISNNRQIVSDIERGNEVIDLEKLFSSLTPGRRRVAVAAVEMYKRQQSQQVERRQIFRSADIYELMGPLIGDLPNEEFWVVSINQAGRLIKKVRISVGGIDQTSADIRLIMRVLIDTGAVQFAAVHNHPSGNSRPSNEDKRLTEQLKKAAGLFNITMIDHVIITNGGYYSFGDEGLI